MNDRRWIGAIAASLFLAPGAASADDAVARRIMDRIEPVAVEEFSEATAMSFVEAVTKTHGVARAREALEALAQRFPVERLRDKLAASCADVGDFGCADEQAAAIDEFNWRARARGQVASGYAEQGDRDEAARRFTLLMRETAAEAPEQYRDRLILGLLGSVVEFGFFDIAAGAVEGIRSDEVRTQAIFLVAAAAADAEPRLAADLYRRGSAAAAPPAQAGDWLLARASVAAAALGSATEAQRWFEAVAAADTREWAAAQIAGGLHRQDRPDEARLWESRVETPARRAWMASLVARSHASAGRCKEALARAAAVESLAWRAASLSSLAKTSANLEKTSPGKPCIEPREIRAAIEKLWDGVAQSGRREAQLAVGLPLVLAAWELGPAEGAPEPEPNATRTQTPPASPAPPAPAVGTRANHIATGRENWACRAEPVVYPGWWEQVTRGLPAPAGEDSMDGLRTAAPSVVKVGRGASAKYVMYYLAEQDAEPAPDVRTTTRILRAQASVDDPTRFEPANVAMAFFGPATPDEADPADSFFNIGPYYVAVVPALDEAGMPTRAADGSLEPWYAYFATYGNNTGVAVSRDGGVTFELPAEGVNPLFPFEVLQNPVTREWRRQPVQAKNKIYDQSGSGSATGVRGADGGFHLFYTARMWNHFNLEDLGASKDQVGQSHRDGHVPIQSIAYAHSRDGLRFTRRSAKALGAKAPTAEGPGWLINPRLAAGPGGEFEYSVTRPMVMEDGIEATTGLKRYRMLVSSHSTTYRVRSLHSTDLINWTWDESPAEGLFGFGAKGSFDDSSTAYATCLRERGDQGEEYRCWYTGNRYGHVLGRSGIGYCTKPVDD